jgi:hypothetical protein
LSAATASTAVAVFVDFNAAKWRMTCRSCQKSPAQREPFGAGKGSDITAQLLVTLEALAPVIDPAKDAPAIAGRPRHHRKQTKETP